MTPSPIEGIGCWPFRKLEHATGNGLVEHLGREGISRAVVYPISAILAKDCMEGNREVAQAGEAHPSIIVPFACINPAFPGWQGDFAACFCDLGFKGLRLFPTYHGYALKDRCFLDVAAAAQERCIPVVLSVRVEDERQHHWLVKVPPLEMTSAAEAIRSFPGLTFVLSGATYNELLSVRRLLQQNENWYFDIGRMQGRHEHPGPVEVVPRAVEEFGARRMLFGSNAPFQYVKSSLLKIQHAPISESEKKLLLSRNAVRVLAIE